MISNSTIFLPNVAFPYMGQTKRALKFKLKKHKGLVCKKELHKSYMPQHCW